MTDRVASHLRDPSLEALAARPARFLMFLGNLFHEIVSFNNWLLCLKTVIPKSEATRNLVRGSSMAAWTHHPRPLASLGVTFSKVLLRQDRNWLAGGKIVLCARCNAAANRPAGGTRGRRFVAS